MVNRPNAKIGRLQRGQIQNRLIAKKADCKEVDCKISQIQNCPNANRSNLK